MKGRRLAVGYSDGAGGTIDAELTVVGSDGSGGVESAVLVAGRHRVPLSVTSGDDEWSIRLTGRLAADDARPWFPATHGEPALEDCAIELDDASGVQSVISLGRVGFRSVVADRSRDGFELWINGVRTFCRGAVWTPIDPVRLSSDRATLDFELRRLAWSGINMVRVPGVTTYECDDFYELCDELGIMVWQDLMLANFDYPIDDDRFRADLAAEIGALADRLCAHPCIVVVCGGTESLQGL